MVKAPDAPAEVAFGTTVTIERDDGRRQTWRIVGEDEADPAQGTLSYVSPVARALMGKRIGDVVRAGNSDAEIVAIVTENSQRLINCSTSRNRKCITSPSATT